MAGFLRHTSCDSCGSSDANAVYDDGSMHCFACSKTIKGDGRMNTSAPRQGDAYLDRLIALWQAKKTSSIPDRGLTASTVERYGVVVDGETQAYPYFSPDQSDPVGFKVRGRDKAFRTVGDTKEAGLFGEQLFGNHDQHRIVITEGELDALAVSQMLKGKTSVVSLRSGAAGAGRDLKASYNFLDGYNEIILCFDADDAGKGAVKKAADVFAGKLRVINLDKSVGKDACDYLKAGLVDEFTKLYFSASQFTPDGVLSTDELWERLSAERPDALGYYPWGKLNALTYGFRPTELVTVTAGSGLGKSSILRELVMHIKNTTDNRIGCLFMEESVERTAEGFMGVDLSTPVHLPTSAVKRGSDEYRQSFERVFGDGQLMIMDASFDTGATVDQVVARVRFMARALDCKVIILDHISILVSGGQHNDERRALDEIMTKLRTLTQDTGIVLFCVSHLKRPEGKGHEEGAVTSVAQLRGSASIAQLSDFVIGLERNGQADDPIERNTTHIRVLKNRFSGITGPAGHLLYDNTTGRLHEHEPEEEEEEAL
jgi:twinkle protein